MDKPLQYTDDVDEDWAERALQTIQVSAAPDTTHPVVLELEGHCPRCGHDIADEHWLITFSGAASLERDDAIRAISTLQDSGAIREPVLPAEFSLQCNCHHPHPDPLKRSGLKGCGAMWRMRFESLEEPQ